MPMTRRVVRAAQAFAAAAVLLVGLPAALLAAADRRFGTPNPLSGLRAPWNWTGEQVGDSISRPIEDDTVVDVLLRGSIVVVWLAIGVIVATTVLEVVHLVRHRGLPSPTRRGLGWAQPIARFIAAGIVGLLPLATAAQPIASLSSPEPATRSTPTPGSVLQLVDDLASIETPGHRDDHDDGDDHGPAVRTDRGPSDLDENERVHVVTRGQSIWSIAESLTGGDEADTLDLAERILDRNLGRRMNDGATFTTAALIHPGWELRLPATTPEPSPADTVTSTSETNDRAEAATSVDSVEVGSGGRVHEVQPGDTLTDIAADRLGDAAAWSEIAELNLGRTMDDGRVFDDPDLILPGWDLIIDTTTTPGAAADPASPPEPPAENEPANENEPATETRIDWFDDDPEPPIATETTPPPAPTQLAPPGATTTTTAVPPAAHGPDDDGIVSPRRAPSPLGPEHAGMLAGGLLLLAAIRRRRRLRAARARARLPEPPAQVAEVERSLRSVGVAETRARLDVAIRSMAHDIVGTGRQPVVVEHRRDGEIRVVLTGPVRLPSPWSGAGSVWSLPASIPVELLADTARHVGDPCPALVAVGRTADGELLVDPEAAGVLSIDAPREAADAVLTSLTSTLATSLAAETAHLVSVGVEQTAVLDHPNATIANDPTDALVTATRLVGRIATGDPGTFDLRTRRTGGEAWEPAIVLVSSDAAATMPWSAVPDPGHGVAVIVAAAAEHERGVRLHADETGWTLATGGWSTTCRPFGLDDDSFERMQDFMTHADAAFVADDEPPADEEATPVDYADPTHAIVVSLLGGVSIAGVDGEQHRWQRSKTVELIAWLATHRSRSTRTGARAAMWVEEIRDATFSNIVSEARRGLARLVPPPGDVEWIPRTLTDELGLHPHVITDLDLVRGRLEAARLAAPAEAIALLRPAVDRVAGVPFADTTYLWPDADGLVTDATLVAISACVELAQHALSLGDVDAVFAATGRGLAVLPGHEESIGLRMRAHAQRGDLAGVRREWESYERVITADAWSNGEPADELLQLRHDLLNS